MNALDTFLLGLGLGSIGTRLLQDDHPKRLENPEADPDPFESLPDALRDHLQDLMAAGRQVCATWIDDGIDLLMEQAGRWVPVGRVTSGDTPSSGPRRSRRRARGAPDLNRNAARNRQNSPEVIWND